MLRRLLRRHRGLRAGAGAAVLTAALAAGCGTGGATAPGPDAASRSSSASASTSGGGSASSSSSGSAPVTPLDLPRGGRTIFPTYRLVGYAGVTGAVALGRLGIGDLNERVVELEKRAQPYAQGRRIMPVLEVIATIVKPGPGKDGKYRIRLSDADIATYLKAARRHRAMLLLNIQPGRSSFLDEVKSYRSFVEQPDVGVALDPEWAMSPGQRPGHEYGHTTGADLDAVSRYLSALVQEKDLPEKVMVYHQVAAVVVRHESGLKDHPGVVAIKSVDGIGTKSEKTDTYNAVNETTPSFVHAGFKLFYEEDARTGPLMTPAQVLALKPKPEYVMYE